MKIHNKWPLITSVFILFQLSGNYTNLLATETEARPDQKQINQPRPIVFSIYDSDKSGSLSPDEYHVFVEYIENRRRMTGRPMRRYLPLLNFEGIDTNNDGSISEEEMIAALNKHLRKHRRYRQKRGYW